MSAEPLPAVEPAKDPELGADHFDVVVARTRGLPSLRVRELWAYRELLYFFGWRDVKVRYKQTVLGVGWAVIQPVLAMILFTFVFGHVAKISSGGVPYPIFAYSALVLWYFFANSVQLASNSLVGSTQLITKVYFPRILVAASPIMAGLLDFALAFLVLVGLMAYYAIAPGIGAIALPGFLLMTVASTLGVGAWLSALNVKYRDVRFFVPFLIQLWFFVTPIVYPIDSLGQRWQTLYGLNPMTGPVLGFRWALAGGAPPSWQTILLSAASALALLCVGLLYFGRTEKTFADVI